MSQRSHASAEYAMKKMRTRREEVEGSGHCAVASGWQPTRPLAGYSGSITAISRIHGTTRSIRA